MNEVNRTLYIPLYGKAYVSRKGMLLHDPKAEEIWSKAGFPLKGKSRSKWLAYYMGMRSAVFDAWTREKIARQDNTVVLHIGCGLDSRALRVPHEGVLWYDIDFADVIAERRLHFEETPDTRMLAADARETDWLSQIRGEHAIVLMEGVSMYMTQDELGALLRAITQHFASACLLMDCYTTLAARASKYKNPINDVGVTTVHGMDDPSAIEEAAGLTFVREHDMTPKGLIDQLSGLEKPIFRRLYAGRIAKAMYRLFEYESGR